MRQRVPTAFPLLILPGAFQLASLVRGDGVDTLRGVTADGQTHKATVHQRVRRQHAAELAQDYVEAIQHHLNSGGEVKVRDLQDDFGVSHVTVIRTLQRLKDQDLVTDTRSRQIQLTEEGKALAREAAERHRLLRRFFIHLGVSEEQADADAEGAEHHLSRETLGAIEKFLDD